MKTPATSDGTFASATIFGLLLAVCCGAPLIFAAVAAVIPALLGAHQILIGDVAAVGLVAVSISVTSRRNGGPMRIIGGALRRAFSLPLLVRSVLLLGFVGVPLTVFYFIALPAERFGALAWGALNFLTPGEAIASVIIGFGVALSIALDVAAQRARATETSLSVGGVIAALLPSSLCCTTLIPSGLALLGASAPAIMHLSGKLQGFFAQYAAAFIGFAVTAVLLSLWLSAKRLVEGCTTCNVSLQEFS